MLPERSGPSPCRRHRGRSGSNTGSTSRMGRPPRRRASNRRAGGSHGRAASRPRPRAGRRLHRPTRRPPPRRAPASAVGNRQRRHPTGHGARSRYPTPASGMARAEWCHPARVPRADPTDASTPAPRQSRRRSPWPEGPRCSRRSAERSPPDRRCHRSDRASSACMRSRHGSATGESPLCRMPSASSRCRGRTGPNRHCRRQEPGQSGPSVTRTVRRCPARARSREPA